MQVWTRVFSSQATLAGSLVLRCLRKPKSRSHVSWCSGRWGSSAVRKYVRVAGLAGISRNLGKGGCHQVFQTILIPCEGAHQCTDGFLPPTWGPRRFAVRCTHCGWNWSSAPDIYRPRSRRGDWQLGANTVQRSRTDLRRGRECTVGPVGCGDTPVNHFTASGVHALQR